MKFVFLGNPSNTKLLLRKQASWCKVLMGSVMVLAPSRPSSLHTQSTENLPILRLGIFCFPIGSSCSSALATLVGLFVFVMPVKSSSSEDSSTSSETDSDWTRNDGSTSEEEELGLSPKMAPVIGQRNVFISELRF